MEVGKGLSYTEYDEIYTHSHICTYYIEPDVYSEACTRRGIRDFFSTHV